MVDWSAASSRGPARPAPDRCWIAWGRPGQRRRPPRYFRTRLEAEGRLRDLIAKERGSVLVGFDFPFGYPVGWGLPAGRALCAALAGMIEDRADGGNNRFEVANRLNREIQRRRGAGSGGPFWGHPPGRRFSHLSASRPGPFAASAGAERRMVERRLIGQRIQSPWKLYTTGSVGSQALMGLPAVHRLITHPALAHRARLWPFETHWDRALRSPRMRDAVVVAEIWPSLGDWRRQPYRIKDARQVAAMRDWALEDPAGLRRALGRPHGLSEREERRCRDREGWILGPWSRS